MAGADIGSGKSGSTARQRRPGLLHRVVQDWQQRWSLQREFGRLAPADLERVLADIGADRATLTALSHCASDTPDLMRQRMRLFGLDAEQVARAFPAVMRDIQRVCTNCAVQGRCRHELEAGGPASGTEDICPNAPTFHDLRGAAHSH